MRYSLLFSNETFRIVLARAVVLNLELEQLDVKIAFLHGNRDEEIYMTQPKGFIEENKENMVCRLTNSYKFKTGVRCWYKQFESFIWSFSYRRWEADHSAYFHEMENDNFIILLLYVDYMIVAYTSKR